MGRGVRCIESTALIEALRGGYPSGSGVPSSSGKVTTYFQHIVWPLIFGIWFGVFPIGTARRPIQLQSATRHPDCAWTVGTEYVGIVWCTPVLVQVPDHRRRRQGDGDTPPTPKKMGINIFSGNYHVKCGNYPANIT